MGGGGLPDTTVSTRQGAGDDDKIGEIKFYSTTALALNPKPLLALKLYILSLELALNYKPYTPHPKP
jgi:hypothetical protein